MTDRKPETDRQTAQQSSAHLAAQIQALAKDVSQTGGEAPTAATIRARVDTVLAAWAGRISKWAPGKWGG
jgi:hypothetical protein